jgi:hypothetical protein
MNQTTAATADTTSAARRDSPVRQRSRRGRVGSAAAYGHPGPSPRAGSHHGVVGHPREVLEIGRGSGSMLPRGKAVAGLAWCVRTAEEISRVRE